MRGLISDVIAPITGALPGSPAMQAQVGCQARQQEAVSQPPKQ